METGDCFEFFRCQIAKDRDIETRSGNIELRLLFLELWPEREMNKRRSNGSFLFVKLFALR